MKILRIILSVFIMLILFSGCNEPEDDNDHNNHTNDKQENKKESVMHEEHKEVTEDEKHNEDEKDKEKHDKKEEKFQYLKHQGYTHRSLQKKLAQRKKAEGLAKETLISLSDDIIKKTGIKVSLVSKGKLKKLIKLPGEIVPNQDKVQHIFPRFSGLTKKVYKKIGDRVRSGDVLVLIQNNETLSTYEVKALLPGTIISKHITVGEVVKEDNEIYVIADLSTVWIYLDVYSKDEPYLKVGQIMTIEAIGSKLKTEGKISYISPIYNKKTRTLTARIVLPNYNGRWRPGGFVKGYKYTTISKAVLIIPKDAVQIVEQKQVVFIPVTKNSFKPVPVIIGDSDEKFVHIKSGLKLGDRIVSQGAFELKAHMVTSSMGGHAGHGH